MTDIDMRDLGATEPGRGRGSFRALSRVRVRRAVRAAAVVAALMLAASVPVLLRLWPLLPAIHD